MLAIIRSLMGRLGVDVDNQFLANTSISRESLLLLYSVWFMHGLFTLKTVAFHTLRGLIAVVIRRVADLQSSTFRIATERRLRGFKQRSDLQSEHQH